MKQIKENRLCQVERRLYNLPELAGHKLAVQSEDGVVTLSGWVKSRAEKTAAENAAIETQGVKVVASEILVAPVIERSDVDIAKDLLHALSSHLGIATNDLKVIVSEGRVTLEGEIDYEIGRLFAEAVARGVRGVVGVRNQIQIKQIVPTEPRSAAGDDGQASELEEAWIETGAAEAG